MKLLSRVPKLKLTIASLFIVVFAGIGTYFLFFSHAATLAGDINGDGSVTITDLSLLLSSFNRNQAACASNANYICDLNNDGVVNVFDLSILLANFGKSVTTPVPSIPASLSATPGDTKVSLSWSASTETGGSIANYEVFRNGSQIATPSSNSYTDTGLANGTTYSYYVKAVDGSGTVSAASNSVSATPAGSSGGGGGGTAGAVVPTAPSGPAAPSGGWSVEYANAFGACLIDTATQCSGGYARQDNTLGASTHSNGAGNPNEIAAEMPSAVDVTAQGLDLHCSATANLGDSYTCGAVTDGANGSSPSPGGFHWTPASNVNLVIEASFKAPPNQGNMDPSFWVNGPGDNPEIDIPEMWGMNHVPPAGASNTWCGFQFGDPAVPFDNGPTGNVQATFCQSPATNLDPSSGYHKWTFWENGDTFTSYIDGMQVGSKTYSGFNGGKGLFKMLLMASMREDPPGGGKRSGYPFPAGGNDLIFRYVAVYEPKSANHAGTNGPIIVPGTTIK